MNPPHTEDSLRKRYGFKIFSNGIDFSLAMLTAGITPRALGPVLYGNFEFLSAFFLELVNMLDAGTSTCFYSRLSKRSASRDLMRFYWGFAAVLSVIIFTGVGSILLAGQAQTVWPDQHAGFIVMASIWGLLTWYKEIASRIVDAFGLTIKGETFRIVQRTLGTALLLFMFWPGYFTLYQFFFITISCFCFYCCVGYGFCAGPGSIPCPAFEWPGTRGKDTRRISSITRPR